MKPRVAMLYITGYSEELRYVLLVHGVEAYLKPKNTL